MSFADGTLKRMGSSRCTRDEMRPAGCPESTPEIDVCAEMQLALSRGTPLLLRAVPFCALPIASRCPWSLPSRAVSDRDPGSGSSSMQPRWTVRYRRERLLPKPA